ncbi:MAG: hypothetical protein VX209_00260 [Thermoproteota archaeon]|nr:hypothetical protein [Thermoproteota archaeon]
MNSKEKAISHIASAIAVYSVKKEEGTIPDNVSMIDFISKTIPDEIENEISIELIDEIFDYISKIRINS